MQYKSCITIMRCKNCGWPNKPNEMVCVKCGSPLDVEIPEFHGNDCQPGFQPSEMSNDGDGLKKTVMESATFGPSIDQPESETPTIAETTCPKCGYPMRSDATKCPNCNYSLSPSPSESNTGGGYQRRPTRMAQQEPEEPILKQTRKVNPGAGKFSGTVNPYMMNYQAEPAFILQPIQRMNERRPVETQEFEGDEVILKRENTEPNNPTISTKEQAIITHNEGHWYIEDKSEQKTTFVQAASRIELHEGDIILLGNRLFEFKEQ